MARTTTPARLDAEWRSIVKAPASRSALDRWARREPALAAFDNLDDLLAGRRQPESAAEVLPALGRLSPHDPLAARTLLQALIPGLTELARTAGYDDDSSFDDMVSIAWERIRTYPETRTGSVAANVLLDVRKRYREHRRLDAPNSAPPPSAARAGAHPSAEEEAMLTQAVVDRIVSIRRTGLVSDRTLHLIVRTRVSDESLDDVAAKTSVNTRCLFARRKRGEVYLRRHLDPVA